jgi:acetoacetyl-CoA synthetase
VVEGLVVHLEDREGAPGELVLFVVLAADSELDDAVRDRIRAALRTSLSPRHVPDRIERVPAIPKTLTGKKLELPVKQILMGAAPNEVASRDALADPSALDPFVALAHA